MHSTCCGYWKGVRYSSIITCIMWVVDGLSRMCSIRSERRVVTETALSSEPQSECQSQTVTTVCVSTAYVQQQYQTAADAIPRARCHIGTRQPLTVTRSH